MATEREDAGRGRSPQWPPETAATRLRELFQECIPGLAERAEEYTTDTELDADVWDSFDAEMRRSLERLEAACPARDAGAVRGRGHSLEGMGGTVGLPDLSVVGVELSQAAREQDWARCALLVQQLGAWVAGLRAVEGGGAPVAPAVPPQPSQALVLIADDDPPNLAMLRKVLTARGYEVLEAADGPTALQLAQQRLPSLALLDVEMPGLNGYEVCRRLKKGPKTREIAVIVVTARCAAEDVEKGLQAGAFDYIRKPYDDRELLARVRNALELKRTTDELRASQRRVSDEIQAAWSLQRKLFPTQPRRGPGYEVSLTNRPSLSIGGDLFDAFPLPDGRLCVYIGDVAGHGVAPAIVSALLKAIITEVACGLAASGPAAVCREIQQRFRRHVANPALYATLFVAFLDTRRREWICMNCGHPDPILMQADGTNLSHHLTGRGDVPIGFWFGAPEGYAVDAEVSAPAPPGSTLWLITDGLFEARDRRTGEPCGPERLLALVERIQAGGGSCSPAGQLLADLEGTGFRLDTDDCSAIAVECVDPATIRMDCRLLPELKAVSEAAAEVERILQAEGWSDLEASRARSVAMEHLANIHKHGGPPLRADIHFQMRLIGSACRMWCTDRGREWERPSRVKSMDEVPLTSESGRGLPLIQDYTSYREYFRRDHENVALFAVDRYPAAPPTGAAADAAR